MAPSQRRRPPPWSGTSWLYAKALFVGCFLSDLWLDKGLMRAADSKGWMARRSKMSTTQQHHGQDLTKILRRHDVPRCLQKSNRIPREIGAVDALVNHIE